MKHLLNTSSSAAITFISSKFEICIHETQREGGMANNFDIGHNFYLRKCRN